MTKILLRLVLGVSPLWIGAGCAFASPGALHQTLSTSVRYADLNLSSSDGAQAMLTRIKSAARRVCDPEPSFTEFEAYADWRKCMTDSVSDAVGRLNAPLVTAAYDGSASHRTQLASAEPG